LIRLPFLTLQRASLPNLERLARWLGCLPPRGEWMSDEAWRQTVIRAVVRWERRAIG